MSHFIKYGNKVQVAGDGAIDIGRSLPVGNYIVKKDEQTRTIYLEMSEKFANPSKLYGSTEKQTVRILDTFESRENSTGVMLVGEKGSGKTMLARNICIEAAKRKIPTLIISTAMHGENQQGMSYGTEFNKLVQDVSQPCVILFDEFEKMYNKEQQEDILSLLDGAFLSKKLFVFTCNDRWRVDANMKNRPGRIFYMIEFHSLEEIFVREYCEDNLNNKEQIDQIIQITSLFSQFNFDMLKALVEEMNRYGETPQEAIRLLNAKPEYDDGNVRYEVEITVNKKAIPKDKLHSSYHEWKGNPLQKSVEIYMNLGGPEDEDGDNWSTIKFTPGDIADVDGVKGEFIFENRAGQRLKLTRIKDKYFDFMKMI